MERRLTFGQVPDAYDELRAPYPDALIDDIVAYSGVRPGDVALEVGAGTGIATRALVARGLRVDVVEPDSAMAAVLLRRCADETSADDARGGAGNKVRVIGVSGFEEFTPPATYRMLVAAQSWHWVDPAVRWTRAKAALTSNGAIAIFGHKPWPAPNAKELVDAAFERYDASDGPPATGRGAHYAPGFADELAESRLFGDIEHRCYEFTETLDRDRYVAWIATMSNVRVLAPGQREKLLSELGDVVDKLGGRIGVDYITDLYLARAAHASSPTP